MKYHIISTSNKGHGAIFTNSKDAKYYQKAHPGSTYTILDQLPSKIPPKDKSVTTAEGFSVDTTAGDILLDLPKSQTSSEITVYTDGSSLGNPGPGGYGVVIQIEGESYELSQGYRHTTNNRMEMLAVIKALEALKDNNHTDSEITIHSDSQYTINSIVKGWAKSWRRKDWKKSDGKQALNVDLWAVMLGLLELFPDLTFEWVKGHAGDPLNERADELANSAAGNDIDMIDDKGYQT